jgi:hypothetical protein
MVHDAGLQALANTLCEADCQYVGDTGVNVPLAAAAYAVAVSSLTLTCTCSPPSQALSAIERVCGASILELKVREMFSSAGGSPPLSSFEQAKNNVTVHNIVDNIFKFIILVFISKNFLLIYLSLPFVRGCLESPISSLVTK